SAIMFGPEASFLAELFGTRVRYTGASCSFQLGAVTGGVAPIVTAALAASSGNLTAVGLLLLCMGLVSTLSALAGGPAVGQMDCCRRGGNRRRLSAARPWLALSVMSEPTRHALTGFWTRFVGRNWRSLPGRTDEPGTRATCGSWLRPIRDRPRSGCPN